MQVPKKFKDDLRDAYNNKCHFEKLIRDNKNFILRVVSYSMRGYERFLVSDKDDLFQEACYWMINSMAEWDKDRGVTLDRYVVYNMGVRLRNVVKSEARKTFREISITETDTDSICKFTINIKDEKQTPNIEDSYRINEYFTHIRTNKPFLVNKLLDCLLLEEGNFTKACKTLRRYVRTPKNMSEDGFRQYVWKHHLPALRTDTKLAEII